MTHWSGLGRDPVRWTWYGRQPQGRPPLDQGTPLLHNWHYGKRRGKRHRDGYREQRHP